MRIIGAADEFWRLRLTRVDTTDDFDFEWHEDILYRQPVVRPAGEVELWHVEAVQIADLDVRVRIATFAEREQAEAFFGRVKEDLSEMTKSQFDQTYLSGCSADEEDPQGR